MQPLKGRWFTIDSTGNLVTEGGKKSVFVKKSGEKAYRAIYIESKYKVFLRFEMILSFYHIE